jgi:tRNA dimethylallyltransferase
MSECQNTVIIITGPTASGKTALAIKLAQHLNTVIISADSRQCFRELNIGVAKPSVEELNAVKHYFVNSHSIHDNVTAQLFEEYAINITNEIFKQSRFIVMAGGTGLYIKAFCEGLDLIPEIDASIREKVSDQYAAYGMEWLQEQVQQYDNEFWQVAEQQNPRRLMRALEVKLSTSKSILQFRKGVQKTRSFNIVKFGIDISKEQLYNNIDSRTDNMMKAGLLQEASSLFPYRHINALQTVGYKEIFEYMEGIESLSSSIAKIKRNTRQYAKRQLTWFRKDLDIKWINANKFLLNVDEYLP